MLVKEIMIKKVISITKKDTLQKAYQLMKEYSIRHLPVVEKGNLIGIVSDRDLRRALIPSLIDKINISEIMVKSPITVTPQTDIEEAAKLLCIHKIGCLPVVAGKKLVGIISETDLLSVLVKILGLIRSSVRVDVVLGDSPKAFVEVTRIIKENKGDIISVGMSAHENKKDRIYYFRLEARNVEPIVLALKKAGYKVL